MTLRAFGTGRKRNNGRWLMAGALLATTALVAVPEVRAQATFNGIDYLYWPDPEDPSEVRVSAISGNGAYIGGSLVHSASGLFRAHRWPDLGVPEDLGSSPGANSYVTGLSYDGSVVVGYSTFNLMPGAFRWTQDGGLEYIGSLGGNFSQAHGVSDDGSKVVGVARIDPALGYADRGFVWIKDATGGVASNPQMYEMRGALAGAILREVTGISGDGRYVIGAETGAVGPWQALRYDVSGIQDGVMTHTWLGNLGGVTGAHATDISTDGSVIVGSSGMIVDGASYDRAFRWVEGATGGHDGGPMYELGTLGGHSSWATGVSGDGEVVVGRAFDVNQIVHAFRWEEATGMIAVADWLRAAGVDIDVQLTDASGVSADGSIVVGTMFDGDNNQVGYIARVVPPEPNPNPGEPNPNPNPGPGTGLMNIEEYQRSLFSTTQVAQAGEFLTWLPLNGAHHRPLMQQRSMADGNCVWATGDLGYHGVQQAGVALAEVGGCVELLGGSVVAGLGVGASQSWQPLSLGGSSHLNGQYVIGEVDWQPDGTPLLLSVTGMLGGWQANLHRGYSNGAATAYSDGQTSVTSGVVRLRADWLDAASFGNTTINPWASVAFSRQSVGAFTESGGPFPAHFDAQTLGTAEVRLGVAAVTTLSTQTTLTSTLELAHRGGDAPAARGHVLGLFDFDMGGRTYGATWLRAGLELDHQISNSLALSGSVHAATNGRDPSVSGSVGLKLSF